MVGTISGSRYAISPRAMALILVVVSILGGLTSLINPSYGGYRVGYDNRLLGVSVAYSPQPSQDPEFVIMIKDRGGRPLKTMYSVYIWMPGGEIESLGVYGGSGIVKINYSVVRDFSRRWHDYIASRNSDPRMVKPGLILMGAIHENGAVYDTLRSVPIDTKEILGNKSVVVVITKDLSAEKPLMGIDQTHQSTGSREMIANQRLQTNRSLEMIFNACKSIDFATDVCYVWHLDKDYSGMDVPLPLIAIYVHGSYADKVDFVNFRAHYGSTSSMSIDFKVVAGVGDGTNLDYEIIGTTMTLTGDNAWLNEDRTYRNNLDFVPPVMLGIGFLGDVALARYRLYRYSAASMPMPTNVTANITLMRPAINSNKMIFHMIRDSNPSDNMGILENTFKYYKNYWIWSQIISSQRSVLIDMLKVRDQIDSLPELSASIGVTGALCSVSKEACEIVAVSPSIFSAPVKSAYMYLGVLIGLKTEYVDSGYSINAIYFYSPNTLLYGNNRYYIGSLYIDVYVTR